MAQEIIMSPEQVDYFLNNAKEKLESDDSWQINNQPRASGKVNKTRAYMAETGITAEDIKQVIKELSVKNYCSTRDDANINFPNEQVWIFGIRKNIIDEDVDLYIKLKIRKLNDEYLLILSFHPEQFKKPEDKLQFPYSNYTN